ncbi:DGQHR domain-containing protein DpdB (plasmid) [Nonomuraea sp. NBC_00507]|uniref:DGQHR domain-containing protein DpdB n=1 Tax=Nonomuraea sp. NBC_00507 TaxID=2976002 RepID=UPI002E1731AA
MSVAYVLRLPALRIQQGIHTLYSFAVDGKLIHNFAAVSRIKRDDDGDLLGYQRPETYKHVLSIRRYLEGEGALMPNSLTVAFGQQVHFEPFDIDMPDAATVGYAIFGVLVIPIDPTQDDADKPAWIVDGQQRSAAIRDAALDQWPVPIVGFIADPEEQRTQFLLVNSVKPLPKGLIHELLPSATGTLPPAWARRQVPATILAQLNTTPGAFAGAIRTPTEPDGRITDNAVLRMIETSLYNGALYQYRNPVDGAVNVDAAVAHLTVFWDLVARRWPAAWKFAPRLSRLTHGVGIQALGVIMDDLTTDQLNPDHVWAALDRIGDQAAWTFADGHWELRNGETRRWSGFQNTGADVRLLSDHLRHLAGLLG